MNKLLFLIVIGNIIYSQSFKEIAESYLRISYDVSEPITFNTYTLLSQKKKRLEKLYQQIFFRPSLYTWRFRVKDKIYYAALDNVLGKVQPITFLVIFTENGITEKVEILKYRETHGYEVKRRSFLDQYNGKTSKERLELYKNVDGITGATISARSLTIGINKLAELYEDIMEAFNELK